MLTVRQLGMQPYAPVWRAMQAFTDQRDGSTGDEIWLVQHPPVFTLGLAGKAEHVLDPRDIPVIKTDRGGQVTYHGPGQVVAYLLLDLKRQLKGVRPLVSATESAIIALLDEWGIQAARRPRAPGVYVRGKKIAALGFRVRRGCSYHGLSLNVDMDLEPFSRINPCGYEGMEVTQIADLLPAIDPAGIEEALTRQLSRALGYDLNPRIQV
ncbi:MAG TPA: lipoyl(octanoyl) transferase LipB [Chromatiales bacterium]|nr:lipoyl(octanoyl) transferase LipB [Chromatiales bacterium]